LHIYLNCNRSKDMTLSDKLFRFENCFTRFGFYKRFHLLPPLPGKESIQGEQDHQKFKEFYNTHVT